MLHAGSPLGSILRINSHKALKEAGTKQHEILKCDADAPRALADPTGNSGAGMVMNSSMS